MKPIICICCGEPMTIASAKKSRNPNICPSCLSLADMLDDEEDYTFCHEVPVVNNSVAVQAQNAVTTANA